MSGLIYLRHGNGLVPMTEAAYDSEDVLQRLLAEYPDLLAGEQVNAAAPRRWLLIAREAGLPSEEGGSDRWSIDHLFLDQDGIPTIVEVKRSSDSRIRREVVGQMLDYAANAVIYWPAETLRARFEARCVAEGIDTEELLEVLSPDIDIDVFWQQVKTNLQAGRIRMIFVADVIPDELRRVVEFLNGQMRSAEVLAVEVKQYVGEGQQALVPRVIGQTQQASSMKSVASPSSMRPASQWDEPTFLAELRAIATESDVQLAQRVMTWARGQHLEEAWGKGKVQGSYYPQIRHNGRACRLLSIWTTLDFSVEINRITTMPPFTDVALSDQLIAKMNTVPGYSIQYKDKGAWRKFASFDAPDTLDQLLSVIDWVIEEIRKQ